MFQVTEMPLDQLESWHFSPSYDPKEANLAVFSTDNIPTTPLQRQDLMEHGFYLYFGTLLNTSVEPLLVYHANS